MAIRWAREIATGREGDQSALKDKTSVYSWRLRRNFLVMMELKTDTSVDVLAGLDPDGDRIGLIDSTGEAGVVLFPLIGDAHPGALSALCLSVKATPHTESAFHWFVAADYSQEDPTDEPPDIDWDVEAKKKALEFDENDDAIVNSAGDPFEPPLEEETGDFGFTISRNLAEFDPAVYANYIFRTNSQPFLNYPIGTLWLRRIRSKRAYKINVRYYPTTFVFLYNPDGWTQNPLDRGLRQLVGGVLKPMYDLGVKISKPVLLDGSGARLGVGGTPVELEFVTKGSADFNELNVWSDIP